MEWPYTTFFSVALKWLMQLCYIYKWIANVCLQFMDELSAPRYIMPMVVSICQHCDEQQFWNTVMCTLHNFLSSKVWFMHTSTVSRLHSYFEKKYAYASRASCYTSTMPAKRCRTLYLLLHLLENKHKTWSNSVINHTKQLYIDIWQYNIW